MNIKRFLMFCVFVIFLCFLWQLTIFRLFENEVIKILIIAMTNVIIAFVFLRKSNDNEKE